MLMATNVLIIKKTKNLSEVRKLVYDGLVKISTGRSRRATHWDLEEITWSDLVTKLGTVIRTHETVEEWKAMKSSQRDDIKDVGGFVGGTLKNGIRKAVNVEERYLLTLDLDSIPKKVDPWLSIPMVLDYGAVLYSTHSHSPNSPRYRMVFPLSRAVSPDEYEALSRLIAQDIGMDFCDDTTYDTNRLMYWASCSQNAEFRFEYHDAPWIQVDTHLARYDNWTDPCQWPRSSRQNKVFQQLAEKQEDPLTKTGIIGAFCRIYPIEVAIATFLGDRYEPCGENRFTFIGGSTVGGLVLYEGKFAYSHHSTDPISGKLCNAFDLVRIHLFGEADENVAHNTKPQNFPSFQAMCEKIDKIPEIDMELKREQLPDIMKMFDDGFDYSTPQSEEEKKKSMEWLTRLEVHPKTRKILSTIDNIYLIVTHDPRLKDTYFLDEFKNRAMVEKDLPWANFKERTTNQWTDNDDAGLRWILEKEYKIDQPSKVRDGIDLALQEKKRHPVREYLQGLVWDGVSRVETLLVDYLGAEDSAFTRATTKKALIGAVGRIMNPGCKFDYVLVLVGPQGCGKSTLLGKLGMQWFSDSLYTMTGKDAYELLDGNWIIELSEMAATRKAEVEQFKAFISKQEDTYRAAYARRTQTHPRQCAFFGTTNEYEFIKDLTGSRRVWPIIVTAEKGYTRPKLAQDIVDMLWAESVAYYKNGESNYLPKELEALAVEAQKAHTEENGKQGIVETFLEKRLPEDWDSRTLEQRRIFWDEDLGANATGTIERQTICAYEIWSELFEGNKKSYTQSQAREINNILKRIEGWEANAMTDCGKLYKRQRGFRRKL